MHLIKLFTVVALAAPLVGADTPAPGVGSGNANDASGPAQDAGGKAGTETGTGKGTDSETTSAKAGGNNADANDADGDLARTGRDVELDTLPAAVKSAVTKEAAAQEISTIRQRTTATGKTTYDVDVKRGGKSETVCFDEKGMKCDKDGNKLQ
ncbi:MAG: hypothetical protein H0X45_03310 [Planctomycetes bacterium]|nr:hypothetical protein [Planctomycetota bacterium]